MAPPRPRHVANGARGGGGREAQLGWVRAVGLNYLGIFLDHKTFSLNVFSRLKNSLVQQEITGRRVCFLAIRRWMADRSRRFGGYWRFGGIQLLFFFVLFCWPPGRFIGWRISCVCLAPIFSPFYCYRRDHFAENEVRVVCPPCTSLHIVLFFFFCTTAVLLFLSCSCFKCRGATIALDTAR